MPENVTRGLRVVPFPFGSVTKLSIIFFSFLPAWLLLAAFCNALIQVDKLPDATQVLAGNQQQQRLNSTESFEGADYRTCKYFRIPSKNFIVKQ